jgi:hypothetical protein
MSADLPSQIQSEITGLDASKQRQVLDFVRALKQPPKGLLGSDLKEYAGTLSEADARSMIEVIEAACEQVDADGW